VQCTGSVSQSVYLDAGSYSISFVAAQRAKHQASSQEIAVVLDGVQVDAITPSSTSYASYETLSFAVTTTGMHTIAFVGLNPTGGDNTAFLDDVAISEANSISDGSFEVPSLTAATYQYNPTGTPWEFSGSAGVAYNRSGFTTGNASAPDGYQVAFLQATGSISQSVYLDAGAYNISLLAAQRAKCQTSYQQIEVLVDGVCVGTITPTSKSFGSYQTENFEITTAGLHTIEFVGLNPQGGDNTALIDNVTIDSVENSVTDGSFESPTLVAKTYDCSTDGSSWEFSDGAGVTTNSSAFTGSNPNTAYGTQVAFLQGGASMSQSVYLDAGNYAVSFVAAQRGYYQDTYQEFEVLINGTVIGTFTPATTKYESCQTASFAVSTSGMYTLQFVGLNPDGEDNTAFVDNVAISAADPIGDSSFEQVSLTAGTYQYQPTGSNWQYTGSAGVTSNSSAFTSGGSTAPSGTQVGFIQGTGSISQSFYLDAGTYTLTFEAAQRSGTAQTYYQQLSVLIDGVQVALITPSSTKYSTYQVSSLLVSTSGMHTIKFVGLDPKGGSNTAFLDCVQMASV